MDEKRRFQRVTFWEPVEYRMIEGQTSSSFEGGQYGGSCGCDISEGGIRLRLNHFVPLRAEMSLTFPVGREYVTNVEGRVAWVQRVPHSEMYQIGLEFQETSSSPQSRSDIHQFIEEMS